MAFGDFVRPSAQPFRKRAHLLYLLLAIPSFLLLLIAFPNFHAPDDPDHFKRAYTLLEAPFDIVTPQGKSSGAIVDSGITLYAEEQYLVVMRPDWAPADVSKGGNPLQDLQWGQPDVFSTMAGAVAYLPFLYAPQSLAVAVGRATGMSIDQTVLLARILNGLAAISLTWLALYLLPQGHALVLALLFMPRTMLQYASNSADPLLFAFTLFILAVALRPALRRMSINLAMAGAIFLAAAVRPPLGALAMVPIGFGLLQRRAKLAIPAGIAALSAAAWILWAQTQIVDQRCPGEQGSLFEMIFGFVTNMPSLIVNSFAQHGSYYFISLVAHYGFGNGPAGYVNAPLAWPVYALAFLLFAWALRVDSAQPNHLLRTSRVLLVLAAIAMTLVTFLAMYVGCTAVKSGAVAGVQGRYFVTMLFTLAPAIAGLLAPRHAWSSHAYAVALSLWVAGCLALMVTAAPGLYRL